MANPQAENGHTDIANEIVEALSKYRLSGQEWQCLLVVFRKTYGWKKVEDEISLSQYQRSTGLSRPSVVRSLNKLVSKKVLISTHLGTTHAKKYKFNKNYEEWSASTQRCTSNNFKLVPKKIPVLVPKQITQLVPKKRHTKETITKETSKEKSIVNFESIWQRYPNKDGKKAAERHFNATVKNHHDFFDISTALDNYIAHLNENEWKKPKNGSTWFNSWQDWIFWEEPPKVRRGDPGLRSPVTREPGT